MSQLNGKVAIVTGGASGIGLATARRLAEEGAAVVVADLNEEAGEKEAEAIGGRFVKVDVGDPASWSALIAAAKDFGGGVDIAHLNAGVTTQNGDIRTLSDEQYRRILSANVDGVVYGTRACVPAIAERGGGAIVATASLAGVIAFAPDPIYTLTKHAVVGFVRSVAAQLEPLGITINAVCPAVVDTPLVGDARDRLREAGFPMMPPEDIAAAVLACVLGDATGQCVVCQKDRAPAAYEWTEVAGARRLNGPLPSLRG